MSRHRFISFSCIAAAMSFLGLAAAGPVGVGAAQDKGPISQARVYVYPEKLTDKDKLSFGPGVAQKNTIPIKGETTLIYVDLDPDARFAHDTQCILISTNGARVIKGSWWLVLNGKAIFRDGKNPKVDLPIKLTGK